MIYAIDTNILVYAYNLDSSLNPKASSFLEENVLTGKIKACLPYQCLYEFFAIITDVKRVEKPLYPEEAKGILGTYMNARNIPKIYPRKSNLRNTLGLLLKYNITKQEIFDAVFVATLLDNGISGVITNDTKHFSRFDFLSVLNPFSE